MEASRSEEHRGSLERLQRGGLRAMEESLLLRRMRELRRTVTETSLGSFGLFGALYALFSMSGWRAAEGESKILLWQMTLVLIPSVFLLTVRQSLGYALRRSRIFGGFWFGFCGFSRFSCAGGREGRARPMAASMLALLFSVLRFRLSAALLWGACVGILLLITAFALPDLCTVFTLCVLPFLEYTGHPTVALCILAGLSLIGWLWKAASARRCCLLRAIDEWTAMLLLSALLCTLTGAGSWQQGFVALLTTAFFIPVRNLLLQDRWRRRAVVGLCLSGSVSALIGVAEYALGQAALRWVDASRFGDIGGRVCGPFSNPNIFAVWLLGVAPILLAECGSRERRIGWRLLCGGGFLATCTAILLTYTRGAWLGLFAEVALFCLLFSRRSAALAVLSILPLCSCVPFLPQGMRNRLMSIGAASDSSVRYRFHTWRGVLRMIEANPFGIGLGEDAFLRVFRQYAVSGTEQVMHAHSLGLQLLAEQGFGGALIFLIWMILLLVSAFWRRAPLETRGELIGLLCALVGIGVLGLFDYVWYHFGMRCLFFALAALMTLPGERMMEREGLL